MKFENVEKFRAFLDANMKSEYDLDVCLEDLERQVHETGVERYELSQAETISGNPECISFEIVENFILNGMEVPPCDDYDFVEETVVF